MEQKGKKEEERKESRIFEEFLTLERAEDGTVKKGVFHYPENFNFAYDVLDRIAEKTPDKPALVWVGDDFSEKVFSFKEISLLSMRAANFLAAQGIKKGDRIVLALRRNWQFWIIMMACTRLGAVTVMVNNQLLQHDFQYRFEKIGASGVICSAMDRTIEEASLAADKCPAVKVRISTCGTRNDWIDFDKAFPAYPASFPRDPSHKATDPLLIFFSSGTTGFPKGIIHIHTYPLGHIMTAHWWQQVDPEGLHLTISDTGWAKAMWGKLFGQWLCEGAVFVYDFDRFHASKILPLFKKYRITTFCAPATMFRFFIREDLSHYDFSTLEHVGMAGEALNPEVMNRFADLTGQVIHEGFGQSESPVLLATGIGIAPKAGSMGKPNPLFPIVLLDPDGKEVPQGETGEICIKAESGEIPGLFVKYYDDPEETLRVWHDGYYHTGDTAWCDEDGYFWYVGRVDDVIKSSGYRIGPFEIESTLMELPYVLECGVVGAPDPVRGQAVKAYIVLTKDKKPSPALVKEIQDYVKSQTAPYKYPRLIEFMTELPKTVSGKIIRKELREMAKKSKG
ncbi:MAG: AMP-binding protein [Lentisphaeria bacterium]|nr:AMP-binding protein [Lentisphaeria bacterium]